MDESIYGGSQLWVDLERYLAISFLSFKQPWELRLRHVVMELRDLTVEDSGLHSQEETFDADHDHRLISHEAKLERYWREGERLLKHSKYALLKLYQPPKPQERLNDYIPQLLSDIVTTDDHMFMFMAHVLLCYELLECAGSSKTNDKASESSGYNLTQYAVAIWWALVFLSFVYQYLIGCIDRGGTKTYSPGSLKFRTTFVSLLKTNSPGLSEFRATFVSLLLFQGSYIWIKFRNVASFKGVYRRPKTDKICSEIIGYGKYEPRFKPRREKDAVSGRNISFNHIPLGGYDTYEEATAVYQIAAFYYGQDEGLLDLGDGESFSIPTMSAEEQRLSGMVKYYWVSVKVREVYTKFNEEKARRKLGVFHMANNTSTTAHSGEQIADAPVYSSHSAGADIPTTDDVMGGMTIRELAVEGHDPMPFVSSALENQLIGGGELNVHDEQAIGGLSLLNQCLSDPVSPTPEQKDDADWWIAVFQNITACQVEVLPTADGGGKYMGQYVFNDVCEAPFDWASSQLEPSFQVNELLNSSTFDAFSYDLTSTDLLVDVVSSQEQHLKEYQRRISELEREIERLKGTLQ